MKELRNILTEPFGLYGTCDILFPLAYVCGLVPEGAGGAVIEPEGALDTPAGGARGRQRGT